MLFFLVCKCNNVHLFATRAQKYKGSDCFHEHRIACFSFDFRLLESRNVGFWPAGCLTLLSINLLIYWAHALPGQIYYCPGARLGPRPPSRIRANQTPTSTFQVPTSDFETPFSSFQAPTSRPQVPISGIPSRLDGQRLLTPSV